MHLKNRREINLELSVDHGAVVIITRRRNLSRYLTNLMQKFISQ